jgi:hypothetical protein
MQLRKRSLVAAFAATAALAALPSAASAADFPLVGWWPMNEGTGQVVRDWSGHGSNGVLGNSPGVDSQDPTWIRGVFLGSALRFDGGDLVQIPDSPGLNVSKVTVAAWVRNTASPGINRYILAKGSDQCVRASYGMYTSSNGGVAFYVSDHDQFYRSPEAPTSVWDGKWHNVAGTFDGTTVRLYVDGKQIGNGTPASGPIDYTLATGGGLIGDYHGTDRDGVDCDLFMTGDIDGVQVWSQALPIDTIWRALASLFQLSR